MFSAVNLEIIIQCRTVMTHCHVTICLINDWFKVENGYCLNCKQNTRKFQAKPNMLTFCESNVLFITSTLSQAQSASTGIPDSSCSREANSIQIQNDTESIFCWNCKFGKKNKEKWSENPFRHWHHKLPRIPKTPASICRTLSLAEPKSEACQCAHLSWCRRSPRRFVCWKTPGSWGKRGSS